MPPPSPPRTPGQQLQHPSAQQCFVERLLAVFDELGHPIPGLGVTLLPRGHLFNTIPALSPVRSTATAMLYTLLQPCCTLPGA